MLKSKSFESVLDLFFPPVCPLCQEKWILNNLEDKPSPGYCAECIEKLICDFENYCQKCGLPVGKEVNTPDCRTCRGRSIYYDQLLFVNEYKTYIGELILNFKYGKDKLLAHFLGKMLYDRIKSKYDDIEVIIPVPMHWIKKLKRGFNQADLIGLELSQYMKVPLETSLLKRSRKGENQAGQSRTTRYKGVKELYYIKKPLHYKSVLLVDDVVTTASTLSECARLLKNAGCEKVYCATIAGVHRDK